MSRSREGRKNPAFMAIPAASLQSFQSAITEEAEQFGGSSLRFSYSESVV
jgi:hypothetical protein